MKVRIARLKQVQSRLSRNVTRINNTKPVKPGTLKLHDIYVEHSDKRLIYLNFECSYVLVRNSGLHFTLLFPRPSGLHPGTNFRSSERPVILRLEDPAGDLVGGLRSPGAQESPLGKSKRQSSLAVIGEPGP